MKKSTFTILGLATLIVILTSGVKGVTDQNGRTGSTTTGCGGGGCHTTQAGVVSLTGLPTTVLPSTLYTFDLVYTPPASQIFWGLDIKASTGTLAAATGMKKSGTEVTHSAPLGGTSAASYTYTGIKWTSPAAVGAVTFNFACVGNTIKTTPAGANWQKGTFSTTVVLPVEFRSFGVVKLSNNIVAINWETATEINTHHFEVEKSFDGSIFETIAKQNATGNSTTVKTYTAKDIITNTNKVVYYRIKSVDKDGAIAYSKIETISSKGNVNYVSNVYPNPAKKGQNINIEIISDKEQTAFFTISNVQGKIVSTKEKIVTQGFNNVSLKLSNFLAANNYYLEVKIGNTISKQFNIAIVE